MIQSSCPWSRLQTPNSNATIHSAHADEPIVFVHTAMAQPVANIHTKIVNLFTPKYAIVPLIVASRLMLTYAPLSTPSPLEIQYALERRERKTYRLPRLPGSGGGTRGFP